MVRKLCLAIRRGDSLFGQTLILAALIMLVSACGPASTAVPPTATVVPPVATPVPPTSTHTATPSPTETTVPLPIAAPTTTDDLKLDVPLGNPPTIDGTLSAAEWSGARTVSLADGQLLFVHDGTYLYLGIRSDVPGLGSICVDRGDTVAVLHSSASLGTAIYEKSGEGWERTRDFAWTRSYGSHLEREGWLASDANMGAGGEMEYQIAMPEGVMRLVVTVLKETDFTSPTVWPAHLADDCRKIELLQGYAPARIRLSPETWMTVMASAMPAPASPTPTVLPEILADSGRRLKSDRTFSIALGDLDRDGDLDAVVANYLSTGKVWWNDGTGVFEEGQNVGTETAHGIALGDLDGDGDLDALIVHNGDVDQVWLNDGAGRLADSGQQLGKPEDATTMVSLGDVDGDGDLDAFTTHYQKSVKLWLNDGGGVFAARDAGPGSDALSVAVGDVDGDGDLDALVSFVENPDRVWLNDGRGAFADSGQALSGESGWGRAALGDIDGDGDLDAFVSNSVSGNAIWFNTRGAQGGTPGIFASSDQVLGQGNYATLGDMDGDGDLDALTCQGLWLNDGDGTFRDAGIQFNVAGCGGVWLGDLDGDGDLDAFVGSHQRDNELWLNKTR